MGKEEKYDKFVKKCKPFLEKGFTIEKITISKKKIESHIVEPQNRSCGEFEFEEPFIGKVSLIAIENSTPFILAFEWSSLHKVEGYEIMNISVATPADFGVVQLSEDTDIFHSVVCSIRNQERIIPYVDWSGRYKKIKKKEKDELNLYVCIKK